MFFLPEGGQTARQNSAHEKGQIKKKKISKKTSTAVLLQKYIFHWNLSALKI